MLMIDITAIIGYRVKHLNPRQGITTSDIEANRRLDRRGVKHLNPRQGITTLRPTAL